ncbi:GH1 family beta-glucosidase [Kallotenue papyrolyticum]|uniref:GH1 family beta-glucosidase n=1 Tax=Kallotenue papyrolyticum TaxID=1325125 RepID=UPI0004785FDE|nr:GH1 family beta-glucosidase [Kallotenue papyrolyticum]
MQPGQFPDDFVWGAATAAYQIEGAVDEDGRAPSIWDTFSHTPGKTWNGDTGDVACDHYHRWPEDVQIMRDLGLEAYRFSIAWPRVIPGGWGQPNPRGLDFYDSLVDALLAANITPFVTLYHWDLPQALQDRGGWANRDTVEAFLEYAEAVVQRLGDRVTHWITHNEPQVVAFVGHALGLHAPGLTDQRTALQVAHHLLLSHGRAVPLLRSARAGMQVGITLNLSPVVPASQQPEDQRAAALYDALINRWFLDPVFGRGYPQELLAQLGDLAPQMADNDLDMIAASLDFLGVNYYFPSYVRAVPPQQAPLGVATLTPEELAARGFELTAMGWPIVPDGLRDLLVHVHREYAPRAIYITENGAAFDDQVVDGAVQDQRRIAYLREHLLAASAAIQEGVPLRGYFVWSLMDNFEWAYGYSKRFGIVYVDYATQQRIPKASAEWYRRVIAENRVPLED